MNTGSPTGSAIEEIFSGFNDLRKKEPWLYLWTVRFIQFIAIFCVIEVAGVWIFHTFNIPTSIENARYFLSAMVQAQAAIVALVITLTLIAIQMASASYTPRVVDVMKKSPDMWFLLVIYIEAMSIGFFALEIVTDPVNQYLVPSVLILGIFTFCILFLYIINTIALLRPDAVVKMLVKEINAENIHQEGWNKESEDDIMQPVFDMVHASINRFDVTTTRTGLNALSERILGLFPAFHEKNREKIVEDIARHFCNHIQRSALVALRNDDEGMLNEISKVLRKFGIGCCDYQSPVVALVPETLAFIGSLVADKELEGATWMVVHALGEVGIHTADRRKEDATGIVINALMVVGIHAADKELESATRKVTYALKVVGIHAADKQMREATWMVAEALRVVGINAADKRMMDATKNVVHALGEVGIYAADKELEGATIWDATTQGFPTAGKGLMGAINRVVHALCRLGLMETGQNAAAETLAQLMFRYNSIMTEPIKEFESEFKPEQKNQFTTFMKKVNEELHKLESSEKPQ